jgi:hypothetical protein
MLWPTFDVDDRAFQDTPEDTAARRLLAALREAGAYCFIEDDPLFVSPPARRVVWHGDTEEAIDELYWELKALVSAERLTVH